MGEYNKHIASLKQQNEEYSQTIKSLRIQTAEQKKLIDGLMIGNYESQSSHQQIAKQIHESTVNDFVEMQNEEFALRHELGQIKAMITEECKHPFIDDSSSKVKFVHIENDQNVYHFQVISDFFMNDSFDAKAMDALKLKIDQMSKQNKDQMELLIDNGVSSETTVSSMASESSMNDESDNEEDIFSEDDYDEMEELFKKTLCDFETPSLKIYVSPKDSGKDQLFEKPNENKFVWLGFTNNRY